MQTTVLFVSLIVLLLCQDQYYQNNAIWDPNLKFRPATTLVKVKFQILDTYGVIVSSPKQFDIDRLKVKVIEMVLKVRPYLKKIETLFFFIFWCADNCYTILVGLKNVSEQRNDFTNNTSIFEV